MKNKTIFYFLVILGISLFPNNFISAQTVTPTLDTQTLINQLQEQIKSLQAQIEQMRTELKATKIELEEVKAEIRFTKTLRKGMTGDEVKQLQEFLKQFPDIYPEGLVTGYFGSATERAIKKFQEQNAKEILNPLGLKEATGIVGQSTIAKLNELAQGAIPATPATPAQPSPGEGIPAVSAIPATPAVPPTPETPTSWPTPVIATSTATTTSITVVQPNGGEHFQKGSTYVIVWNSLNVSEVFIRLLKNNEIYMGSGRFISGVMPNSGYYKWTVPTALPDDKDYTIQVVGGGYEAVDTSDSFFAILTKAPASTPTPTVPPSPATTTPSITILYPNGGEQWQKGTTQLIKWNSTNVNSVYIKLRKGSDTYYATSSVLGADAMISGTIPNAFYFQWAIPTTLPDGNDYAIRVISGDSMGAGPLDDSDAFFSIVTIAQAPVPTPIPTPTPVVPTTPATTTTAFVAVLSPNGGETWIRGNTYTITWNNPLTAGFSGDANYRWTVSLSRGSTSWIIDPPVPVTQSYTQWTQTQWNSNWSGGTLPTDASDYKVAVALLRNCAFSPASSCPAANQIVSGGVSYDFTGSASYDYSDNYFSIVASSTAATTSPAIIVLSPSGGETWQYNQNYEIQYSSNGVSRVGFRLVKANSPVVLESSSPTTVGSPLYFSLSDSQLSSVATGSDYRMVVYDWDNNGVNNNPNVSGVGNYFSIIYVGTPPATSSATTTTSACTGLSLTFANNKTNYTQGEMVNYTWSCIPSGTTAPNVTIKVDGVTYNSSSNSGTQTFGFGTSNFSTGPHTIKACFDPNCLPSPTVTQDFNVIVSDTALPIISAVSAFTTADSATITWTTDEPSDSSVEFGITTSYGSQTSLDTSLVTSHSVNVLGLSGGTTYHYRVKSRDASNNLATSDDYTLTTSQAVAMTIRGRVVNGLTNEPVSNSNMFIWNWKGSTQRQFYLNPDGTFSINLTADDIANAHSMYVNYVFVNGNACYDQSNFIINKNANNSISSIGVSGPGGYQGLTGIVNRTVQPTGTETDIGDLLVWPVTGFNLVSDIPVRFNGYFENGGGGAGNGNYQTNHGFSTFYPVEINTRITLIDQSGNQYNSAYVKYSMSQHCSQVTLNFSNGQFSWNPPGTVSGSTATTTSPSLILENITSQLASISEIVSRLMQEIKNLIR